MKLSRQQAEALGIKAPKRPAKPRSAAGTPTAEHVIFLSLCACWGLPLPDPEHFFHSTRGWRFDYAWPTARLAVEIQGGLFSAGRHVRGAALLKEYEKLNEAVLAGWRVLLVTPAQVKDGSAFALIKRALEELKRCTIQ